MNHRLRAFKMPGGHHSLQHVFPKKDTPLHGCDWPLSYYYEGFLENSYFFIMLMIRFHFLSNMSNKLLTYRTLRIVFPQHLSNDWAFLILQIEPHTWNSLKIITTDLLCKAACVFFPHSDICGNPPVAEKK